MRGGCCKYGVDPVKWVLSVRCRSCEMGVVSMMWIL